MAEKEHREFSRSFVMLLASYKAENAEERFEKSKQLMSSKLKAAFGEKILNAQLIAIESSQRTQDFEIFDEETEHEKLDTEVRLTIFTGERTRTVRKKNSKPIEISYLVTSTFDQTTSALSISNLEIQITPGQEQALSEERLLEKFNEASGAAKIEREKFVEAVNMVSKDLKEHEKKVVDNFGKLNKSLEKLGGTVRKLKDETVKLRQKRIEDAQKRAEEVKKSTIPQATPTPNSAPNELSF